MTTILERPRLTARGLALDDDPARFERLRSSADAQNDAEALRSRLAEDGYLFLPGLLNVDEVLGARRFITERLAAEGHLEPNTPHDAAIARAGINMSFRADLAQDNPPLHQLLYSGAMMDFYRRLFGEPVLHYDYTWLRAAAPGKNSSPHCDIVYMGRGTFDVLTAWTPLGDVPITDGSLMVLEGSHNKRTELEDYLRRDVDTYCENRSSSSPDHWEWDGVLSHDAAALQAELGGRWLTADFQAGDLLTFTIGLVHASLDNHSPRIRLSSDSRYQRASEPADERWIGPQPMGHGRAAMRGRVC